MVRRALFIHNLIHKGILMSDTRKITHVKVTTLPQFPGDRPTPKIMVRLDAGDEWHKLFEYFSDAIDFTVDCTTAELMGKTVDAALKLRTQKDRAYLQSTPAAARRVEVPIELLLWQFLNVRHSRWHFGQWLMRSLRAIGFRRRSK